MMISSVDWSQDQSHRLVINFATSRILMDSSSSKTSHIRIVMENHELRQTVGSLWFFRFGQQYSRWCNSPNHSISHKLRNFLAEFWVGCGFGFWRFFWWLFSQSFAEMNILLNIFPQEYLVFKGLCSSSYWILSMFSIAIAQLLGWGGIAGAVAPVDGAQPADVTDKKVDWDGLRWSRMLFIMLRRVGPQRQVSGQVSWQEGLNF